ncbi:hypothetical protein ACFY97_09825 [Streptomyces klenkii]|uniref:hypothetical protein n=1 Tax=Streptomyces klenkii TaxID=1420899 RepID=UPI0018F4C278|nr:hypothetical protein [Streptomyces klenkii]
MQSTEDRPPASERLDNQWRGYVQLIVTNFLRGASYACGTGVAGFVLWWVQSR